MSERLRHFFGGYFHQDWALENADWRKQAASAVHGQPANEMRELVAEMDALLACGLNDDDLIRKLHGELGCDFEPRGLGMLATTWVRELREVLVGSLLVQSLPFQIEPYESDGHMRWEIDLASMKATLLLESFDDVWNGTTFEMRRSEGAWQYYEDAETWKARVDGLAEQLVRTHINFSGLSLTGEVKNLVEDAQTEVAKELAEARERGPSWIDLPKDVSKAIETRWKEQRGEP